MTKFGNVRRNAGVTLSTREFLGRESSLPRRVSALQRVAVFSEPATLTCARAIHRNIRRTSKQFGRVNGPCERPRYANAVKRSGRKFQQHRILLGVCRKREAYTSSTARDSLRRKEQVKRYVSQAAAFTQCAVVRDAVDDDNCAFVSGFWWRHTFHSFIDLFVNIYNDNV